MRRFGTQGRVYPISQYTKEVTDLIEYIYSMK